jgi:lysophospholipase L1-like esterase
MFGINDALIRSDTKQPQVSKIQFEKNITTMVAKLKAQNAKVLLMTNLPVNESVYYKTQSTNNPNIKQLYADKGGIRAWENSYNEIIRKLAKQHKVQLIDNYANAVHKAGNTSDSMLTKSGLIDPLLGFHWTPRGQLMVAYSVNYYLTK